MLSLSFSFLFKNKELQTKLLGAQKSHRNPLCKIKKESSYDREYKKVNTLREYERERERAPFFYTIDRYVDIDCIYYAGKNKVLKPQKPIPSPFHLFPKLLCCCTLASYTESPKECGINIQANKYHHILD